MKEEDFKGDWHMALALVFSASAAYNLMRFTSTHALRNAVNAGLYGALTWWEIHQAKRHWDET